MDLNLSEPGFIATDLPQGDVANSAIFPHRVLVDPSLGIAGIFDPATKLGLASRQTKPREVRALGVPAGPYLVPPSSAPPTSMRPQRSPQCGCDIATCSA